jgi:predicted nucleic-acid-binding Zn-ribbon protein
VTLLIECPWCQNEVEIKNGKCPMCHHNLHEVTDKDFITTKEEELNEIGVEGLIKKNFKCSKCQEEDCRIKEVAMTGTGLSKLFDIEHNHFLFVSCNNCGFVEVYDPDVLNGKKSGSLGTIMDILFGH